jgi:hypothetical protein
MQTDSRAHPAFFAVGFKFLSWWKRSWGVTFTTHFHLVLMLRMSGVVSLLSQYAFMPWTGTAAPYEVFVTSTGIML